MKTYLAIISCQDGSNVRSTNWGIGLWKVSSHSGDLHLFLDRLSMSDPIFSSTKQMLAPGSRCWP